MPRHKIEDDALILHDGTDPLPVREGWDFTGSGGTITDDSGNNQTVVDLVGGGSISLMRNKWVVYGNFNAHDPSSLGAFPYYVNLGTHDNDSTYDGGDIDFIGALTDPSIGRFQFAETGLYVINFYVHDVFTGSAPATPPGYRIQTGGRNGGWEANSEILRGASATQIEWGAFIHICDWFASDDVIRFKRNSSVTPTSVPNMSIDTWIARIA